MESKSEEGWQEATTSALQKRYPESLFPHHRLELRLGVHSSFVPQSWVCPSSDRACFPACQHCISLSPLPSCSRKENIWSSLTSRPPQVAPSCSEQLQATQRKVPVALSHVLTWELSQQGGEGLPCHRLQKYVTLTWATHKQIIALEATKEKWNTWKRQNSVHLFIKAKIILEYPSYPITEENQMARSSYTRTKNPSLIPCPLCGNTFTLITFSKLVCICTGDKNTSPSITAGSKSSNNLKIKLAPSWGISLLPDALKSICKNA